MSLEWRSLGIVWPYKPPDGATPLPAVVGLGGHARTEFVVLFTLQCGLKWAAGLASTVSILDGQSYVLLPAPAMDAGCVVVVQAPAGNTQASTPHWQ